MASRTTGDLDTAVRDRLSASVRVHTDLVRHSAAIAEASGILISAYMAGRKALIFGNGGSAADAQHLAAELVGRFYLERRALPALALTVNTSALTALGNDYGFETVFARQIEALGVPGDVAIGLSTSGNSPNVLAGLAMARLQGLMTIGLTGADGGRMREAASLCIRVPSTEVARIQEGHILIGHILCELVEQAIFAAASASHA